MVSIVAIPLDWFGGGMRNKGNKEDGNNTTGSGAEGCSVAGVGGSNTSSSVSCIDGGGDHHPDGYGSLEWSSNWSIGGGHNGKNRNNSNTSNTSEETRSLLVVDSDMSNRSSGVSGGGSAINSFHERLVVSIESAISSSRNIRRNSDNDRFAPGDGDNALGGGAGAAAAAGVRRKCEGGGGGPTTRTTYRSGSSSVGHSPKKTGKMTTSVASQKIGGGGGPNNEELRETGDQLGLHQRQEQMRASENIKPATSNHSSISSLLSALSGAAGSSFSITGGGGGGGEKKSSRTSCFTAGGGFPTASSFTSLISNSLSSNRSSGAAGASKGSTDNNSSALATGTRTRAASISSSSPQQVRNHGKSGNHITLNSKVEKVLNSIPGLTLGQVQGAGVPAPATTHSPTTTAPPPTSSPACTWGTMNTTSQSPAQNSIKTAGATTPTTTTTLPISNCNSIPKQINSPTVPQVQIQPAPTTFASDPNNTTKSVSLAGPEPPPQRKHSATFSAFKLSDSAPPKRPLKLKNHSVHTLELYDTLHFKSSATPQVNSFLYSNLLSLLGYLPVTYSFIYYPLQSLNLSDHLKLFASHKLKIINNHHFAIFGKYASTIYTRIHLLSCILIILSTPSSLFLHESHGYDDLTRFSFPSFFISPFH